MTTDVQREMRGGKPNAQPGIVTLSLTVIDVGGASLLFSFMDVTYFTLWAFHFHALVWLDSKSTANLFFQEAAGLCWANDPLMYVGSILFQLNHFHDEIHQHCSNRSLFPRGDSCSLCSKSAAQQPSSHKRALQTLSTYWQLVMKQWGQDSLTHIWSMHTYKLTFQTVLFHVSTAVLRMKTQQHKTDFLSFELELESTRCEAF